MINPYDLLGVTIHSTVDEVRKTYYRLALICHEDKGGSKDDMIAVHAAYKFVLVQAVNRTVTFEDVEKQFKDFCDSQTEAVPKFQDIYADAFDLPKFNAHFAGAAQMTHASDPGGYGDLMDERATPDPAAYQDKEAAEVAHVFTSSVVEYRAPDEMLGGFAAALDITGAATTENGYGMATDGGLQMFDYKQALTPAEPMSADEPKERTLDDLVKERERVYQPSSRGYLNSSFRGMMDGLGNLVKGSLRLGSGDK